MSTFVESLKRLFTSGRMPQAKIVELRLSGKLSDKDFKYITGAEITDKEAFS